MNEQQLADLFSEQLDRMLGGEDVSIPEEAPGLQELLSFGQQFSQLEFQPTPAAQAAFMGQVATWFNAGQGMAAVAGIPKLLLVGAVVAVTALGLGVASFLSSDAGTSPAATVVPAQPVATGESPGPSGGAAPATDDRAETLDEPPATAPRPAVTSSLGDQIELKSTSSLGDVVPLAPSLESTLEPTTTITTTPTVPAVDGQEPAATGSENDGSGSTAPDQAPAGDSEPAQTTEGSDQDRGHGNDPGGYDPDNPGNSSGVSGGNDGNNGSLNPSDFGQGKSGGASGGSDSGGGQGSSSNGKGKSDDKGNKGGNGKGKKK